MVHKVSTRTYRWLHATLGRLIVWYFRVQAPGLGDVPDGPVIFVAPHKAVVDSYVILAVLNKLRPVKIPAKAEYFIEDGESATLKKRCIYWLVKQVGVKVDRDNHDSGRAALSALIEEIKSGGSIVIHPEGTRALDGNIYKAKPGFVHIAWATGAPVVPVVLRGTAIANPPGSRRLRRHAIEVEFLDPVKDLGPTAALHAVEKFGTEKQAARLKRRIIEHQAREVMELFARKLGVHYINEDVRQRQNRMDEY